MTIYHHKSRHLLGAKHGFYTRKGGVSSGIYRGLNCGLGSNDNSKLVNQNRSLVAQSMNVSPSALTFVHQHHSSDVITANKYLNHVKKGDALVTSNKDIVLCILTADCQPVLFVDNENGVIGAAHAGWKGALNGILENTIISMINIGAEKNKISAAVGPTINQKNYEVGTDFYELFHQKDRSNKKYFSKGSQDKYHFNLSKFNVSRLTKAGIKTVDTIGFCTYENSDLYFSYRRSVHKSEADYGRLISTIKLGN